MQIRMVKKNSVATVENSMEAFQKQKQNYHMTQKFPLGYISKKPQSTSSTRGMHPSIHSNIIYNCQATTAT